MDANQSLVIDVQGSAGIIQAVGPIKALKLVVVIPVVDMVVRPESRLLQVMFMCN